MNNNPNPPPADDPRLSEAGGTAFAFPAPLVHNALMPDAPPIRLEITYRFDDFVGHNIGPLEAPLQPTWHRFVLWLAFGAAAMILFLLFGSPVRGGPQLRFNSGQLTSVGVLVGLLAVLAVTLSRRRRSNQKKWNQSTAKTFFLTISPAGMLWELEGKADQHHWLAYSSASESGKAFILKNTRGQSIVLPKRCMTAEEADILRQILRECVQPSRGFPVSPTPAADTPT